MNLKGVFRFGKIKHGALRATKLKLKLTVVRLQKLRNGASHRVAKRALRRR
jgi:hypothetical protein